MKEYEDMKIFFKTSNKTAHSYQYDEKVKEKVKENEQEIRHDFWSVYTGDMCYCKTCCDDRDNGRCH